MGKRWQFISRRSYDRQFNKITSVKLVLEDSCLSLTLQKNYLSIYNSQYRWISKYKEYGESAFPDNGSALSHSQYEIEKLKREN